MPPLPEASFCRPCSFCFIRASSFLDMPKLILGILYRFGCSCCCCWFGWACMWPPATWSLPGRPFCTGNPGCGKPCNIKVKKRRPQCERGRRVANAKQWPDSLNLIYKVFRQWSCFLCKKPKYNKFFEETFCIFLTAMLIGKLEPKMLSVSDGTTDGNSEL